MSDGSKQVILLDTVSLSLYLIMGKASETIEWQRAIRAAAIDNSISLEDQQFTKDDVPVIVEKCINFVYAHGMCFCFGGMIHAWFHCGLGCRSKKSGQRVKAYLMNKSDFAI